MSGFIKEKVLAARRHGVLEVILPKQNEKHINEDLSEELRRGMTIHLVSTVDEVLNIALKPDPTSPDCEDSAGDVLVLDTGQ